jgi:hypothetical protein
MADKIIRLNDILQISETDLQRTKIKFNQDNHYEDPMEVFLTSPDIINNQWLFWRTSQRYFEVGQIAVCFVKLANGFWFLSTIKEVTQEYNVTNGINYSGDEIQKYSSFYGRLIVKYHKGRPQGYWAKTILNEMEVVQILPSVLDGIEFPGYDKVRLSYWQLSTIVNRHKRDWIAALENQKAVYLITDKKSGKQYVGSAYGENGMLLQRWTSYVDNGHGGNMLLKSVVNDFGFDYVKENFQYTILENYNARLDKHIILERESWWKESLGSRAFGLNAN